MLLGVLAVALFALAGWAPYRREFDAAWKQVGAMLLLAAILGLAVFYPISQFGSAGDVDPDTIVFADLFLGHVALSLFLITWWVLKGGETLSRFLHMSSHDLGDKLIEGVQAGVIGWGVTLAGTMIIASAASSAGAATEPTGVPPLVAWMAGLPIGQKLLIIFAAMTVEEGFFRAFLQTRYGLLPSSLMFSLGHFSYGLPFLAVGVLIISLVLGRLFQRTGDLLPCIVAHGVFDAIQLLIVLPWAVSAMQT